MIYNVKARDRSGLRLGTGLASFIFLCFLYRAYFVYYYYYFYTLGCIVPRVKKQKVKIKAGVAIGPGRRQP